MSIQSTQGIIKNVHIRIGVHGPSQGNSLLLTTTNIYSSFPNFSQITTLAANKKTKAHGRIIEIIIKDYYTKTLTGSMSRSGCNAVTPIVFSYLADSKAKPNKILSRTWKENLRFINKTMPFKFIMFRYLV